MLSITSVLGVLLSLVCILFPVCFGEGIQNFSEQCLSRTVSHSGLFGTNTAYRLFQNSKPNDAAWIPSGCSPIHVWMYVRHGTRYPKDKKIDRYRDRLSVLKNLSLQNGISKKATLCLAEYEYLKSWSLFDISSSLGHHLAPEGEREMKQLGRRIRERFREFDVASTAFASTPTQRAQKSAEHFKSGFLGPDGDSVDVFVTEEGDEVLRPYKTCRHYQDNVKNNPDFRSEFRKFRDGAHISALVEKFRDFLHLPENVVTVDDVITAYIVCAFESAWNLTGVNASVWCSPFSNRHDLEAMEYMEDLHRWHVHAHGHPINHQLACGIARNIVGNFRSSAAVSNQLVQGKKITADFHFTHCGALQKLLTRLQLFKDDSFSAEDFPHRSFNRSWRGSQITPFGANVALVLYSCDSNLKVQAFVNEHPARMPFCDDSLCDFEVFAEKVGSGYCHLPSLCGENSAFAYGVAGFVVACALFVAVQSFWVYRKDAEKRGKKL